jgi:DNA (cytosine-5)-methyltransferase 1
VDAEWSFPAPTHSAEALRRAQADGSYWERHRVIRKRRMIPKSHPRAGVPDGLRPWRTVRDALVGLPEPVVGGSRKHLDHTLQPGARSYPGHTGSYIDSPAKALKAGVHGVPGGENMMRDVDGSVRYFTVREAARLQTFPDRYTLHGPWTEAMRQLGNAVPVLLAETAASSVREHLDLADVRARMGRAKSIRAVRHHDRSLQPARHEQPRPLHRHPDARDRPHAA